MDPLQIPEILSKILTHLDLEQWKITRQVNSFWLDVTNFFLRCCNFSRTFKSSDNFLTQAEPLLSSTPFTNFKVIVDDSIEPTHFLQFSHQVTNYFSRHGQCARTMQFQTKLSHVHNRILPNHFVADNYNFLQSVLDSTPCLEKLRINLHSMDISFFLGEYADLPVLQYLNHLQLSITCNLSAILLRKLKLTTNSDFLEKCERRTAQILGIGPNVKSLEMTCSDPTFTQMCFKSLLENASFTKNLDEFYLNVYDPQTLLEWKPFFMNNFLKKLHLGMETFHIKKIDKFVQLVDKILHQHAPTLEEFGLTLLALNEDELKIEVPVLPKLKKLIVKNVTLFPVQECFKSNTTMQEKFPVLDNLELTYPFGFRGDLFYPLFSKKDQVFPQIRELLVTYPRNTEPLEYKEWKWMLDIVFPNATFL